VWLLAQRVDDGFVHEIVCERVVGDQRAREAVQPARSRRSPRVRRPGRAATLPPVFGYNRIPIVSWLRAQALEALTHSQQAGELVTHFGEHPSLAIGPLLETHKHEIGAILRESLAHEQKGLELYRQLLQLTEGRSVMIEEYARKMIETEELHLGEVDKMLRNPGEIKSMR
jgi:bacterioferritin